jgi:hypothetical protein
MMRRARLLAAVTGMAVSLLTGSAFAPATALTGPAAVITGTYTWTINADSTDSFELRDLHLAGRLAVGQKEYQVVATVTTIVGTASCCNPGVATLSPFTITGQTPGQGFQATCGPPPDGRPSHNSGTGATVHAWCNGAVGAGPPAGFALDFRTSGNGLIDAEPFVTTIGV